MWSACTKAVRKYLGEINSWLPISNCFTNLFWSDVHETDEDILKDRRGDLVLVLLLQVQRLVQQLDQRGHVVEQDSSGTTNEWEIQDHIMKEFNFILEILWYACTYWI